MCQWGAIGRARAGADYRTILRTYYPGTVVAAVQVGGTCHRLSRPPRSSWPLPRPQRPSLSDDSTSTSSGWKASASWQARCRRARSSAAKSYGVQADYGEIAPHLRVGFSGELLDLALR